MQKILKERNIEWLLHFTRAENLSNIFKYGLLPINILQNKNIGYIINDSDRFDKTNAICTSIEFPNYRMFYKLRKSNNETDWAVLLLDVKVITDFECAFCTTNAGSEEMYSMTIEERKGKKAFLKLFDELEDGPTRKKLGIGDYYPTDPQAEVLVFDKIPISFIKEVYFENDKALKAYNNVIPKDINAEVNTNAFTYRCDWKYWHGVPNI